MKKHIVCLGDSNTHGYCADPKDCQDSHLLRFNEEERWTKLLQAKLGEDYLVIEEGLSGRTTVFEDPLTEGLCALQYLTPCLKSHEPVDLLIIMLGTNDVKERMHTNAFAVGQGMRRLVNKAKTTDCWGGKSPNILIIAPPVIDARIVRSGVSQEMGEGSVEKSKRVPHHFRIVAKETGCHFLNANEIGNLFNEVDFMHLTKSGHSQLATTLSQMIPLLIS